MRRNVFLKVFPLLLVLLLLCGLYACASAEEDLPAYTGKLTAEDTFNEDTMNLFVNSISASKLYTCNPDRPEWLAMDNWYYTYRVGLTSGEPIQNCTFEQLSGPADLSGVFGFDKRDSLVQFSMGLMSKSAPGAYRFLLTAEGDTHYARTVFSFEIEDQPENMVPLQVRPVLILNTLDTVPNLLESMLISSPEEVSSTYAVYDPATKWYTAYHPEGDAGKEGSNFILEWNEDNEIFTPLSEGVYKVQVYSWLGLLFSQQFDVNVVVSPTLSYDYFALTLTPESLQAAGGQKVAIEAAFANPENVNAKAKNDGIDWSITTADGGDASEFATVSSGTVTIKKLTAAQDLVVTATPVLFPDKAVSVTIHAVPVTAKLSAEADTDTLYVLEGANQAQITVTAEPADAVPAVTWKSSSDKIATVDENGRVTAVSAGSVTITATAGDGSKKNATVKLKVLAPVTGITLSAAQDTVAPGKKVKIKAELEPAKPSDKNLTYAIGSADEGLAEYLKVGKDGTVSVAKGCPAGSFTVQVSANGAAPSSPVTAEIKLTVTE